MSPVLLLIVAPPTPVILDVLEPVALGLHVADLGAAGSWQRHRVLVLRSDRSTLRAMSHTLHGAFDATEAPDVVGTFSLRRIEIATLATHGRIAAVDPLSAAAFDPFARELPAGLYPVELLLAEKNRDVRVALARVVIRAATPTRFELATTEGQDVRVLREDESFGYGVDSGTGCFANADAAVDGDALFAALDMTRVNTWCWATNEDRSCVAFSSGFGDGVYSSYFGLDANGDVVCLVTDFGLLDLELPKHETDVAYRSATATKLLEQLLARLSWLGGERHGEVWETASALGALREDAASAVPALLAALTKAGSALERDVLASVAGSLLGHPVADDALIDAMPRLDDASLARVLGERRAALGTHGEALVTALKSRWPNASFALKTGVLAALTSRGSDPTHASFGALAADGLRAALESPLASHADELALAAITPYRVRNADGGPVHTAPAALLALLPRVAATFDEPTLPRIALDTMVVQRDVERVAAVLDDAESALRLVAARVLSRDKAWGTRVQEILAALGRDPTRSHDDRFDALSHLADPRDRCAGYLALGLEGWPAASIQLGYLASEVRDDALAALERLANEAPTKNLKQRAERDLERLRASHA